MRSIIYFAVIIFSSVSLAGCVHHVTRQQADEKLARGCAAAANALLAEGQKIDAIQSRESMPSPEGPGYRRIVINVKQTDGWLEGQGKYECTFLEDFGVAHNKHNVELYQLRVGDKFYGKAGNEVVGSVEDFVKITDAVRESIYE